MTTEMDGGIILNHTYHSADHLRRVADHIYQTLSTLEQRSGGGG